MTTLPLPVDHFRGDPLGYVTSRLYGLLEHSRNDRLLFALGSRSARTALMLASLRGRLRHRLGLDPRPEELAALFPHAAPRETLRWAQDIAANEAKDKLLYRLVGCHGVSWMIPLLRIRDDARRSILAAAQTPTIFFFAHIGATYGVAAGLGALGVRTMVLRRGNKVFSYPPSFEGWHAATVEHSILSLKRAAEFLKNGGCVLMALDGPEGNASLVRRLLGRQVRLPRGIQVLHNLTHAPVVPVSSPWSSGYRFDLVAHPPLIAAGDPPAADVVDRAVRWLTDTLTRDPTQLRSNYFRSHAVPDEAPVASGDAMNRPVRPAPQP